MSVARIAEWSVYKVAATDCVDLEVAEAQGGSQELWGGAHKGRLVHMWGLGDCVNNIVQATSHGVHQPFKNAKCKIQKCA